MLFMVASYEKNAMKRVGMVDGWHRQWIKTLHKSNSFLKYVEFGLKNLFLEVS